MVKTKEIGTPGPANDKIGGQTLQVFVHSSSSNAQFLQQYYYDFDSKGRGEVVRLFFEEAGIAFVDHRWTFDERNNMSEEEKNQRNPLGSVPIIELNGQILTQSYPLLRRFASQLGKFDGTDTESRYYVDLMCDIASDWRSHFVSNAFDTTKKGLTAKDDKKPFENFKSYLQPKYVQGVEGHLRTNTLSKDGPFVLGKELTYADLVLYQIYHDEREIGGVNLDNAPLLKALVEAVEARPNIKAYMASDRYYN